jgi:hypothetical protein
MVDGNFFCVISTFVNIFENMAIFSLFFLPFFLFFFYLCVSNTFFLECLDPHVSIYCFLIAPCLFCKDTFGERGHDICGALFVEWMDGTMLTLI